MQLRLRVAETHLCRLLLCGFSSLSRPFSLHTVSVTPSFPSPASLHLPSLLPMVVSFVRVLPSCGSCRDTRGHPLHSTVFSLDINQVASFLRCFLIVPGWSMAFRALRVLTFMDSVGPLPPVAVFLLASCVRLGIFSALAALPPLPAP